ncbi:MAG: hypothetical protein DWI21_04655 [Planctomycetota bacterium]|nr:MAG: hypothetical protein DWI21_04655 [Planctomycetota bacterium]GDY06695.1 methylamine utilization protein [Planctomycetia bacterium]
MKTVSSKICWMMTGCAGLLALVVGCGKLDSGAHSEPSVRVKPAELAKVDGGKPVTPADGAVSPGAGGVGTLVGRIAFEGTRPTPGVIYKMGAADKDPSVCSKDGDIPKDDLVVSESKGVANVFVFLDKAPAGFKATPPTEDILFDQKNCRFLTHALFCQVGQTIRLTNSDGVLHNTRCIGTRNGNVNNAISANDSMGIKLIYKQAEREPFPVKCDLHAWMSAYHLVLNHPFAAVSDTEGNFKIENLPAGNYQFKVWHERGDSGKPGLLESKYQVVIKSGDNPAVEIKADAKKFGL